jgi:di/tricarboxylate transporter
VFAGLVSPQTAFAGMGHPAVITVACILIISSALQSTGAVDLLARYVIPKNGSSFVAIGAICVAAVFLSAFMNNVGALALLMPIGVQIAKRFEMSNGKVLMPLAFASILGGMTTLIGTPTNLIVSEFRAQNVGAAFAMFDFTFVGIAVAAAGLCLLIFIGPRLVPNRKQFSADEFETGPYLTEVLVQKKSAVIGMLLRDLEREMDDADAQIISLVRNNKRITAPSPVREIHAGDILVIEAEHDALAKIMFGLGLELAEKPKDPAKSETETDSEDDQSASSAAPASETVLMELAVRPGAELVGRSAKAIRLRTRFDINLLAISREGNRSIKRIRTTRITDGDLLLVQGAPEAVLEFANRYGCIPLADRALRMPDPRKALLTSIIMFVAIIAAATGITSASVAFATGVVALVLTRIIPQSTLYDAVDWPIIIMLAALIPVANAMTTTGAAQIIANALLSTLPSDNPAILLAFILIASMTLSDFMNNAATAAVICPIALQTSQQLGLNADPFLMAVAIGASCSFLTPIGHQNNALILGPGGFRFGDYWKLGLPMEIVVVVVAVPLLLYFWPT